MNHIENEEVVLGAGDAGCSRNEITNRDDKAGPTDGISTTRGASSEGEDVVSGHENYDTDAGEPEKSVPQQEERPQPTPNGENNVRNVMRGSTLVQNNYGVGLVNNLGGRVVIDGNQIGMNLTEGTTFINNMMGDVRINVPQQVQPPQPIPDGANNAVNVIPPQQQFHNLVQNNYGPTLINSIGGSCSVNIIRRNN